MKQEFVPISQSATAPNPPVHKGKSFIGWEQRFDKVGNNLTVKAKYKETESSCSKSKSSSSKGKDAIAAAAQVPQFMLTAMGRDIQVAGARVGSVYAVFDMQGRVGATDFSIRMDRPATYLVCIGSQAQRVKVGSR